MPEKWVLRQYQSLPLNAKHSMTLARIREWYEHWNGDVYVSFSGGKDSTVLAHIVHEYYPEVPLVFVNTGLEYPEIQVFARKMGATFLRPKMQFSEVISTYGYPLISKENAEAIYYARRIQNSHAEKTVQIKRQQLNNNYQKEQPSRETDRRMTQLNWRRDSLQGVGSFSDGTSIFNREKWLPLCQETQFMISHKCCSVMKKSPMGIYQRKEKLLPIIGTLAEESKLREQAWVRKGCNSFEGSKKSSQPMSFWLEQDVLRYIYENSLEIAEVYGDIVAVGDDGFEYTPSPLNCDKLKCSGCQRTGCVFCGFGAHLDKGETRFQRLARTHPKQYEYCMRGGQWVDNPEYDPTAPKMDGDWKNWNPKKIWTPSKEGLGMKKVFDDLNQIYGKDFIKYD